MIGSLRFADGSSAGMRLLLSAVVLLGTEFTKSWNEEGSPGQADTRYARLVECLRHVRSGSDPGVQRGNVHQRIVPLKVSPLAAPFVSQIRAHKRVGMLEGLLSACMAFLSVL